MNEPLLQPQTYEVLKRLPFEWMHMQTAKEEICRATNVPIASVTRRLSALIRMKLLLRRDGIDGPEVRRVDA